MGRCSTGCRMWWGTSTAARTAPIACMRRAGGSRRPAACATCTMPTGRSWRYAWDFAGQLVEVTRPDGQTVSFAYDALGRRVRKTFAGKATRYVWDGNDLVHEMK